ncbi:MAG: hypothetical protein KGQ59_04470 [Bdellovibrionales bacterium]|nr:hypothetical protein [Bdellovibrionales bacterium]
MGGKVFLIGEYAVLCGAPALVAATAPRFQLSKKPFSQALETFFHPESPAGVFCKRRQVLNPWYFFDPAFGAGGFGASSAQFIMAAVSAGVREPLELWREYRAACRADRGPLPSGADVVAQICGGVVEFKFGFNSESQPQIIQRDDGLLRIPIIVIQASAQEGRKTTTHTHLGQISRQMLESLSSDLDSIIQRALTAFSEGNPARFAACLPEYAEVLSRYDLEIAQTRLDREALSVLPGVLGVKGTGALQSDALIAVVDPARFDPEQFKRAVAERGLRIWSERLCAEPGIEVL